MSIRSLLHPTTPDVLDVLADEFDEALEQRLAHEALVLVNKRAARVIARDASEFHSPEFSALAGMVRATLEFETGDVLSTHGFVSEDV